MTKEFHRCSRVLLFVIAILASSLPSAPIAGAAQEPGTAKMVNLQIIVDASGSMAAATDTGTPRIDAAKTVLNEVIAQIPEQNGVNVGLRVYGHKGDNTDLGRQESCGSSELLVPMQGVDKSALTEQVAALQPVGWTPLGFSLEQAANDFTQPASDKVINAVVVVTDGLETCGADPAAIAGKLKNSAVGITTHVIGFGTTPDELAILNGITQASGGQLLGSNNAGQLISALFEILEELKVVKASGSGTDRSAPLAIGRIGRVGEYDINVMAASASPEESGTTGGRDFTVHVAVTYQGDRSGTPLTDLEFAAEGELGIRYTSGENQCQDSLGGASSEPLFNGGSAEFSICWTVAPGDIGSLIMSVQSIYSSREERTWFSLHRDESHTSVASTGDAVQQAPVVVAVGVVDTLKYEPDTLAIPANTDVTLIVYNEGAMQHAFVIDSLAIDSGPLKRGESTQIVLNLPPGTYDFHCNIPGHTEAGQMGIIIVQ